jgi:hypothetical protein
MIVRMPVIVERGGISKHALSEKNRPAEETVTVLVETRHIIVIDRDREWPDSRKVHLVGGTTLTTPMSLDELESLISGGSTYRIELTPEETLSLSR